MGNILRCFKREEDGGGGDHYPYYRPSSRPHYQPQYYDQPAAPVPASRPQQQPLGPHGVTPATVGVAALAHDLLNFESTSMVTCMHSLLLLVRLCRVNTTVFSLIPTYV